MPVSQHLSCLSLAVVLLSALSASAGAGFPAPGREFMLVNTGYTVCLTATEGGPAVAEGRPCAFEDPPPSQRWRYQDRKLINSASGDCLFAPSLVPCRDVTRFDVAYDLLTQHLVLWQPRTLEPMSCHVLQEELGLDDETGEFAWRYSLGRPVLGSDACEIVQPAARWVIVPIAP